MVLRRMGPHPEDHFPKTDLQIIEEVLHEEISSRIGVATSSKQTFSSLPRIQQQKTSAVDKRQEEMDVLL